MSQIDKVFLLLFVHKKKTLPFPLLALLAGCASTPHNPALDLSGTQWRQVECAPYARSLTGLALDGPAYQWWDEAAGHYPRSSRPSVGAVLVFQPSDRLPSGHVSVVAQVVSPREILVDQANWVHDRISRNDQVWDVSAANDWTLVRVWWRPAMSLGVNQYPAYGFVGPAGAGG